MSTWIFLGSYLFYLSVGLWDWSTKIRRGEHISWPYIAMFATAWVMFMVGQFGHKWD